MSTLGKCTIDALGACSPADLGLAAIFVAMALFVVVVSIKWLFD